MPVANMRSTGVPNARIRHFKGSSHSSGRNTRPRLPPQYTFRTITLPVEPCPCRPTSPTGTTSSERGRWYTGWTKSILPLVSFDAKTTEYELANIMDNNPKIKWWLRLQLDDGAYIQLDAGGKYIPIS